MSKVTEKVQLKHFVGLLVLIVVVLSIPFIAGHFSDEVNWGVVDYAVMATLLFITGSVILVGRTLVPTRYKSLLTMGAIILFLLTWAELAVGIL